MITLLTLFNLFSEQNTFTLEFIKLPRCFTTSVATFHFNPRTHALGQNTSKKYLSTQSLNREIYVEIKIHIILTYQKISVLRK